MTQATQVPVGGTGQSGNQQNAPGSAFGVPMYSTQPRFVLDQGNQAMGAVPVAASQINVTATKLDQLDIVRGMKLYVQYGGTWTNTGTGLAVSPFFPANIIQQMQFKLQAAYNTFNQTGPLAAIIQLFRPMWGNRQLGAAYPNTFAKLNLTAAKPTLGSAFTASYAIDVPFAMHFDEYFDLAASGAPARKIYDAIVSPMFMAAQARVVVPTITLAPQLSTLDLLGAPVSRPASDTTSTYTAGSFGAQLYRDAYWTANNPAGNPPQYPWIYTRDYFTQPTAGQAKVGVLIQNTGISVGQVMSLYGFVWDPAANAGLGAIVPMANITSFEIVTGGSLQNIFMSAQALSDKMQSLYGIGDSADTASWPSGIFIFDFAMIEDGGYLSNANCINTYLVNGVQLNITFKAGVVPSSTATVYLGVEALKLATS